MSKKKGILLGTLHSDKPKTELIFLWSDDWIYVCSWQGLEYCCVCVLLLDMKA